MKFVLKKKNDLNIKLFKRYLISSLQKYKKDKNAQEILENDEAFFFFYSKIKAINEYKVKLFEDNFKKYKNINDIIIPFVERIKNMAKNIKSINNKYYNDKNIIYIV